MATISRPAYVLSAILVFAILTFFLLPDFNTDPPSLGIQAKKGRKGYTAPKQNVFAELTAKEAEDVNEFLFEDLAHLNLTKTPKSNRDNFVFYLETLRPNKTDALAYLHGSSEPPQRWAKAILSEYRDDGPYMAHYMVSLPITSKSKTLPLTYVFNSGSNAVRIPTLDFDGLFGVGQSIAANISDITLELLGAEINLEEPESPDGLLCWPRPAGIERGGQVMWFQIFKPGIASGARTLLPQGIYAKVDATSLFAEEWTVEEYYYNGQLYDTADNFRAAIKKSDFVRAPRNDDGPWTATEDFDSQPDGRELPPPVSVQPYGPRYKLDRKQQFVSWFGFEFFITTAQATGVSLFDVKFKGERVVYELGLQEALSHYAGDDPVQGGLEFLDTFLGMGKLMFELIPGYDCPAYADFLDVQWHQLYETNTLPNSICLFEYTSDSLLSRHTAQYSVTTSRNTYLTLRSTSTVGNYDYTVEYIFYLDGTLEVKVRASGFIFGAFYSANSSKTEDLYGHHVNEGLASSMHDHVINFKADMDVAGTANDMVRLAIEPMTKSYPWDLPEIKQRNTMRLVEYPVTEETFLDWPRNGGEMYIVYNSEEKNSWGERKGYRVVPGTGIASPPHLTIENSTTLGDGARWAEHDLWVLRRKDTEPRSADPLNYFNPHDPIIDFTKMANHESLQHGEEDDDYDGDLTLYLNVGSHHVPYVPP